MLPAYKTGVFPLHHEPVKQKTHAPNFEHGWLFETNDRKVLYIERAPMPRRIASLALRIMRGDNRLPPRRIAGALGAVER